MPQRTLLLALSGPSCSGKTTLARLLRSALAPHAFILHEDDFYKTDGEIPIKSVTVKGVSTSMQDWDCLEAVDVDLLVDMLGYVKKEGRVREGFEGKEDQNEVGNVDVDAQVVDRWSSTFAKLLQDIRVKERGQGDGIKIAIIDGFLLYSESMSRVRELFDIKLLLRTSFPTVKRRRESRKGYVTLEGFWEDPEGYVDAIVWPNYVEDHRFLFVGGDVEGDLDGEVCGRLGIEAMGGRLEESDMTGLFEWAAGVLEKRLRALDEE
jgi:nicotinamide/nicotinate riboside kinase